ncbi:uncharacterized protein LOC143579920 [Bidens hawaiensis]|uniref:uncharacterized protein LOC143579920 n=1 Tax=Bidens hawaiensis TaxID=980011 RepID=UPI00404AE25E
MDNYSSGDSSSRDVDPQQPWEDHKVKFMCSYGGKIHPRPHDSQLSYVGGETKILAVHRSVNFATLVAKLTALCDRDVCFKYQLPGEDLDALISVTNDEDLEHMMHEYDRLNKASTSPAKLRLFLFPLNGTPALTPVHSFSSTEREHFMGDLNSGHIQPSSALPPHGNVELMFGLQKGTPASRSQDQILDPSHEQEAAVIDERAMDANRIQKHIQDLQNLRIVEDQQPSLYRKPSDDNLAARDYYVPEKIAPQIPVGYTAAPDQQLYMIQNPASMYHAPNAVPVPVAAPVNQGQGYYIQRIPSREREQPVYNVIPQPQQQPQAQQQFVAQTYTEGYQMVTDSTYGQVAGGGSRQVYYTTTHVAQPLQQQYQPLNQDNGGKVVAANLKELI